MADPRATRGKAAQTERTVETARPAPAVIEGALIVPPGARFAIVASRFNHFIVDRLVEGATDAIARHGGDLGRVSVVRVPGSWEIPAVVARLARSQRVPPSADPRSRSQRAEPFGIIALGAVIRGSTPHFDYVAGEVSKGVASVSLETGVPVSFGILTTDSIEQAIERAGTKSGNKGWDAALGAIEMLSLADALDRAGL